MSSNGLIVEIKNRLAVITFNRPKRRNAMDKKVYKDLTDTLNEISARDDVSITVITGSAGFYSSGNDLLSIMDGDEELNVKISNAVLLVRRMVEAFINHSKVLVAVVNGPAIGIAATTLPLCDIVYCTPEAWFLTPFTRLAICTEGCSSYTFPRIFGSAKASELLLLGTKLTAQEALTSGFVTKIVATEKLEEEVWKPMRDNAEKLSPKSLETSKKLMRRFVEDVLHDANRRECAELEKLFASEEAMIAVANFASSRSRL